jgi:hypothetical protein
LDAQKKPGRFAIESGKKSNSSFIYSQLSDPGFVKNLTAQPLGTFLSLFDIDNSAIGSHGAAVSNMAEHFIF